jgi:DNA-directed RNA polymerase specialized sigma24 family protein
MDTLSALRRLAASQDPEGWGAIQDTHGPGILNMARRITGDDALAEDVCPESLLQIRPHAEQYRPVGEPTDQEATARGWVMRVACFKAFKMLRARAQRREARVAPPRRTAAG